MCGEHPDTRRDTQNWNSTLTVYSVFFLLIGLDKSKIATRTWWLITFDCWVQAIPALPVRSLSCPKARGCWRNRLAFSASWRWGFPEKKDGGCYQRQLRIRSMIPRSGWIHLSHLINRGKLTSNVCWKNLTCPLSILASMSHSMKQIEPYWTHARTLSRRVTKAMTSLGPRPGCLLCFYVSFSLSFPLIQKLNTECFVMSTFASKLHFESMAHQKKKIQDVWRTSWLAVPYTAIAFSYCSPNIIQHCHCTSAESKACR